MISILCRVCSCKHEFLAHSALYPLILSLSGFLSSIYRASFRPLFPLFYLFRVLSRSRFCQRLFGAFFRPRLLPFLPFGRFGLPILGLSGRFASLDVRAFFANARSALCVFFVLRVSVGVDSFNDFSGRFFVPDFCLSYRVFGLDCRFLVCLDGLRRQSCGRSSLMHAARSSSRTFSGPGPFRVAIFRSSGCLGFVCTLSALLFV